MNRQLLYLIFGIVLFGVIQAAKIENDNPGSPVQTQQVKIDRGCVHNMCNETDNYPEAEIRKLLKKYPIYKKLFGTVTQLFHKIASKPQSFQLDEEGEKEEHNNICPTQTFYVVPQKAKDVDGNWQHVVNGINMTQMVIYETCAEGATCHSDCHVTGHTVACRTQGLIFKMLVLSQTPGKESDLELKSFSVPAGCFCGSKFTDLGTQNISN